MTVKVAFMRCSRMLPMMLRMRAPPMVRNSMRVEVATPRFRKGTALWAATSGRDVDHAHAGAGGE